MLVLRCCAVSALLRAGDPGDQLAAGVVPAGTTTGLATRAGAMPCRALELEQAASFTESMMTFGGWRVATGKKSLAGDREAGGQRQDEGVSLPQLDTKQTGSEAGEGACACAVLPPTAELQPSILSLRRPQEAAEEQGQPAAEHPPAPRWRSGCQCRAGRRWRSSAPSPAGAAATIQSRIPARLHRWLHPAGLRPQRWQ